MSESASPSDRLVLYVNGARHDLPSSSAPPSLPLLTYLRDSLCLTGAKRVCGEGLCGACTVTKSVWDHESGRARHTPINACITKLCSLHGCSVTTVEGLGSTSTELHPVQERLYKAHGTQCGMCTPGMVMSMSTILRNKLDGFANEKDLEAALQGNFCRCTGYRPIVEAFRTFLSPEEQEKTAKNDKNEEEIGNRIVASELADFKEYSADCDPPFPEELKGEDFKHGLALVSEDPCTRWYKPTNLEELQEILRETEDRKIKFIAGGTGKFKHPYESDEGVDAFVQVTGVKELKRIEKRIEGVFFGSSLAMQDWGEACGKVADEEGNGKTAVFRCLSTVLLDWVCPQVRGAATLGGHVGWSNPCSDIIPILIAAKCKLEVLTREGKRESVTMDDDFYSGGAFRPKLEEGSLMLGLEVPYSKEEGQVCLYYRRGRRKFLDLPIANAAFFGSLDSNGAVDKGLRMVAGGVETSLQVESAAPAVTLEGVGALLEGKRSMEEVDKEELVKRIAGRVKMDERSPGDLSRYRLCLLAVFVERFFNDLKKKPSESEEKKIQLPLKSRRVFEDSPDEGALFAPVPHSSGAEQTTGEACYVGDMPKYRDELAVLPVLSPFPRGKIASLDFSPALLLPGVVGHLTHEDVPGDNLFGCGERDEEFVASDSVVYAGQIVGAIVAKSEEIGRAARDLVKIEVEEEEDSPAALLLEEAAALKEPDVVGPECTLERGTETTLDTEGTATIKGEVRIGGQKHCYFEPQAALAVPSREKGGCVEIFACVQDPSLVQEDAARALGVHRHRVQVRVRRLGGGFGGKERAQVSVLAALAAHKFGLPCRAALSASEDAAIECYKSNWIVRYEAAVRKEDGRILGVRMEADCNAGATLDSSGFVSNAFLHCADGGYGINRFEAKVRNIRTNTVSRGAFRGFGRSDAHVVAEAVAEHAAYELGMDPVELKGANLARDGDKLWFGDAKMSDANALKECWEEVLRRSDYDKRKKEVEEFNRRSKSIKKGIAVMPMKFPVGLPGKGRMQGFANIRVYSDGSLLLSHGGTEMGQGLNVKMMQVCSSGLGIPLSLIRLGDCGSEWLANTIGTAGSVGSDVNGAAVLHACAQLMERMAPVIEDNPEGGWAEWAEEAVHNRRINLNVMGHYETDECEIDTVNKRGRRATYFTFGAGFVEVEVDCHTGDVTVARAEVVLDLGRSLNPAVDVGQAEGGFVQGMGCALSERLWQCPKTGRVLSSGWGQYMVPGAADAPRELNVTFLQQKDGRPASACHSSKGVGEPPLVLGMGAVPFAVRRALDSYRKKKDWLPVDLPMTCDKIRMAAKDGYTKEAERYAKEVAREDKVAVEA